MAEMTPRERLLAAIRHEEADRVPVSPRISYWLMEYYGNASFETYVRSTREFGYDAFWCAGDATPNYLPGYSEQYELPGVEVEQTKQPDGRCLLVRRTFHTPAGPLSDVTRVPPPRSEYGMGPNPIKLEHLVKSREDLERLTFLLPVLRAKFDAVLQYEKALGDQGLVELNVLGPLEHQAGSARGQENLMMDYYDDRAFFDAQLNLFHRRGLATTRAALEAGVRIIFGNWYWSSLSAGWSPKQFREIFLPKIKAHADLIHSYDGIYHYYDDGKCMTILPWLKEAGVDVFSTCTPPPVGDFDLARAKREVGDRICLKGYVDLLYVVKMGTPELIDRTVREAMEIAKPGGGFILGSSDSFRDGTPVENIRAYFEAGRKYGR